MVLAQAADPKMAYNILMQMKSILFGLEHKFLSWSVVVNK